MNPTLNAIRAGITRGKIESRQMLTNSEDLGSTLVFTTIFIVVMVLMRGSTVPGTDFSLGTMTVPSVLGMSLVFSGVVGIAAGLSVDREDGTLLRAKAIPNGMRGYLVGRVVSSSAYAVGGLVLTLVPCLFLFDGLATGGLTSWLTLAWVLAVGLLATMPLGAIIGALMPSPRSMGLVMLPFSILTAVSGIFYPITALPEWVQGFSQIFPIYWLGLGMRSALLPDSMAAVEIGESWRHLETLGVLGIWAVIGYALAPVVLRRMARRESGSAVAARREKALQQVR
ncbi:ABC-2 type transport system permease protein [Amycolatopsis marina]|uniref:Transport permease protein n=1 Tax=Amycolatopsis marina TaxID=490629 RepID=A0A1I0WWN1_9PSEU|nr:ABC transporter permease [Amycolatopsis marina]SFA93115.1 ABC-2 type transport system permease protein [Amycolatopsis marina]